MTTFNELTEEQCLNNLRMVHLKEGLAASIRDLPDNPKITRLSDRCFTMNMSDLSSDLCLTPEYYDFIRQYELIIQIIDERSVDRAYELMTEIIHKGSIHYPSDTYHRFHPDVVAGLRKIME